MEPTDETAIISDPETAREKFEQARLSRRAALRKMGITTGMALFGMFAVDDLARIAIKKMEENKLTHEVGETVAREFKSSGVVFADTPAEVYGKNFAVDCLANPGKAKDGTPLNCTQCVQGKCLDKYNYMGFIPAPGYSDCYSKGTAGCGGK